MPQWNSFDGDSPYSLSDEGSYEPVVRFCKGDHGYLGSWYRKSSGPIFMGIFRLLTVMVYLCMPDNEKIPWPSSQVCGGVNNFLIDSNSICLLCYLSSSKNRTDMTMWFTHSVSARDPVNQCQSSQPILVHRVRYLQTDKSVHLIICSLECILYVHTDVQPTQNRGVTDFICGTGSVPTSMGCHYEKEYLLEKDISLSSPIFERNEKKLLSWNEQTNSSHQMFLQAVWE